MRLGKRQKMSSMDNSQEKVMGGRPSKATQNTKITHEDNKTRTIVIENKDQDNKLSSPKYRPKWKK